LNKAACYIKLLEYADAKKACEAVLKEDKGNIKAMFRRAQAEYGLKNFQECCADVNRILQMDPKNEQAEQLLAQAQQGQRKEDQKFKGLFGNMCKALGQGVPA